MLLTQQQILIMEKAGKIAAEALHYGKSLVKPGVSLLEVSDKIEAKIKELGGEPAFPTQISLNETAAHNCPREDSKTVFKEEDVVKIDVGVHINGLIADNALTVYLGRDENKKKLVEASKKALENALKAVKPGIAVAEIGKIIEETIAGYGFKPVKNLSGHGLGIYEVHTSPTIPNYDSGSKETLRNNQLIAIEPFASTGAGMIEETSNAEVFVLVNKKSIRTPFTREILGGIEKFHGLPFTTRWLTRKFSGPKVSYALNEMQRLDMIKCFTPLVDRAKGLISQHEQTIIVGDKPKIVTLYKDE